MKETKIKNSISKVKSYLVESEANNETRAAFSVIEQTYLIFESLLNDLTNKQKLTTRLYPDNERNEQILESLNAHLNDVNWNYITEDNKFYVYPDPLKLKRDLTNKKILEAYGEEFMQPWIYEDAADALYSRKDQMEADFKEWEITEHNKKDNPFYLNADEIEYLKIDPYKGFEPLVEMQEETKIKPIRKEEIENDRKPV